MITAQPIIEPYTAIDTGTKNETETIQPSNIKSINNNYQQISTDVDKMIFGTNRQANEFYNWYNKQSNFIKDLVDKKIIDPKKKEALNELELQKDYKNLIESEENLTREEYLANTAYQRLVKDLSKAGLNPRLMFSSASPTGTPIQERISDKDREAENERRKKDREEATKRNLLSSIIGGLIGGLTLGISTAIPKTTIRK